MNGNFDVVVVGNVGIDTNVYLYGADIDFSIEGMPNRASGLATRATMVKKNPSRFWMVHLL
jgi:hypothetical protein